MLRLIQKRFQSSFSSPQLDIKRIIPKNSTFYFRNSDHENNIRELEDLYRKYQYLPKSVDNTTNSRKWISFQQYSPKAGGQRLKPSQHKHLITLLNKLNAIDTQLKPIELSDALIRYSNSSDTNASQQIIKTLDKFGRAKSIGGRKSSTATVYLTKGTGEFLVNGKTLDQHFPELKHRLDASYPLKVVEAEGEFNIFAKVVGGGVTGQSGAIANAIAKNLVIFNPLLKRRLYKAGCMTRDHRHVERKKPGKIKARKSPTWVKR